MTGGSNFRRPPPDESLNIERASAHPDCPPPRSAARNILYLQGTTNPGGSKWSLLDSIDALRETGFQPCVAFPGGGWLGAELEKRDIPAVALPFLAWRKWRERFRVAPSIRRWMTALGPRRVDLVHSNEFWWAPHAILLARHLGVPSVVHLRDGHHTLRKARQYRLDRADRVLAVSSELRQQFQADPSLLDRTEVLFNAHALSEPLPSGAEARARFGIAPGELVIGSAGVLCERKNQRLLLLAAGRLRQSGRLPPCRILMAGEAEPGYDHRLRAEAEAQGLIDQVALAGLVAEMNGFYAAIDLLVHCARREGLPRVIPEAMLAAKPVISTAAEGVRDALPDADHGAVVAIDDVEGLARELDRFLASAELRRRIGETGRRRAREWFTGAAHRARLVGVYRQLAPDRPVRAEGNPRGKRVR